LSGREEGGCKDGRKEVVRTGGGQVKDGRREVVRTGGGQDV